MAAAAGTVELEEALGRAYDLRRRSPVGSSAVFDAEEIFSVLDPDGSPARRERRTARVVEDVIGARGPSPELRWTYRDFRLEIDGRPSDDPDALPLAGASVTFPGVPEAADSYLPPLDRLGFSLSSVVAWMTVEMIIHTHAFAIMTTATHGGVDRLRRLGDEVAMPWSGSTTRVRYGAMIDVTLRRDRSSMRFDGICLRAGRPSALLTCSTPYDIDLAFGAARADVLGHLWVALDDGSLLGAEARQANYLANVPRPDGTTAPMNHIIETRLERVDRR